MLERVRTVLVVMVVVRGAAMIIFAGLKFLLGFLISFCWLTTTVDHASVDVERRRREASTSSTAAMVL